MRTSLVPLADWPFYRLQKVKIDEFEYVRVPSPKKWFNDVVCSFSALAILGGLSMPPSFLLLRFKRELKAISFSSKCSNWPMVSEPQHSLYLQIQVSFELLWKFQPWDMPAIPSGSRYHPFLLFCWYVLTFTSSMLLLLGLMSMYNGEIIHWLIRMSELSISSVRFHYFFLFLGLCNSEP